LAKKIENQILDQFGFSVSVLCRTADEIAATIKNNPLLNQPSIAQEKLHVAFLSDVPAAAALQKLAALTLAPDRSRALGKEVYLYFPNGVSNSSLWKHPLDRVLSVVTTTRNWKTVRTLHQMCLDCH
jgi:uncharacterized protein (DUF1697 family)